MNQRRGDLTREARWLYKGKEVTGWKVNYCIIRRCMSVVMARDAGVIWEAGKRIR